MKYIFSKSRFTLKLQENQSHKSKQAVFQMSVDRVLLLMKRGIMSKLSVFLSGQHWGEAFRDWDLFLQALMRK